MSASRETIRIELSHVASHLRTVREEHEGVFEDSSNTSILGKIIDSLSGEDVLAERAEDIEASFDRIVGEIDDVSYPHICERIIQLKSECRQGNYKKCIRLAESIVGECEYKMDVGTLYEGGDPFGE